MAGTAVDRRDRVGAMVGMATVCLMVVVLTVGVSEDVGDRIVLPIFLAGLALAVAVSRRRLRLLATVVGAGVPAGLMTGAGLRLAMLIAALMGGEVSRSIGGTVGLVVFAAIPATAFSGFVALLRRLVPVRPVVLAAVTLLLGGLALLVPAETRVELAEEGVLVVNLVTFLGPVALFGWLLVTLQERVERWWDRRATARETAVPATQGAPA